jgi:hypothetical protein
MILMPLTDFGDWMAMIRGQSDFIPKTDAV